MRLNLSYEQSSIIANRKAAEAFNKAKADGKVLKDCQEAASIAYEAEMKYYETTEH